MMGTHLPEVLKHAVDDYVSMTNADRVNVRLQRIGFWLKMLKDLRSEEKESKRSMHPDVALILTDKNILAWKKMLEAVNYPDLAVVDEFSQGTDLVGSVNETGLWPKKFQPATLTTTELHDVAKKERGRIISGGPFPADDLTEEIWKQTMEEKQSGWLQGPLSIEDLPESYPLSRRFAIAQGSKVRCIDD